METGGTAMKHFNVTLPELPLIGATQGLLGAAGGIAAFVLDGWGIAAKLQPFIRSPKLLRLLDTGALHFARIIDARGEIVDEALISILGSNESATGFEQIELSCHGGAGSSAA